MKSKGWIALVAIGGLTLAFISVRARRDAVPESEGKAKVIEADEKAAPPAETADSALRGEAKETEQKRRARLMSGNGYRDDFKLSEHDIYLHLQANGSNAVSLVTAFESTRDKSYLKAAAELHPNDPFVHAKILMHDGLPEERDKLIEAFKKSAPDNSFANLLAAREAMKRGDVKAAVAEIAATKGKTYNEYLQESTQGLEDAYLGAGRSVIETKLLAGDLTLPHLGQMKGLGRGFLDLAENSADDPKAQQELLLLNWEIGQRLRTNSERSPLITELVGLAMENTTLRNWPEGVAFGDQTVAEVLAANAVVRNDVRAGQAVFGKWFPTAPDNEIVSYMDRMKEFGEREAIAWLREQHPELAVAAPATH